jgi:hypothetical protein
MRKDRQYHTLQPTAAKDLLVLSFAQICRAKSANKFPEANDMLGNN